MSLHCLTYIGSFPPPYGGVTVKNALLYKRLSDYLTIDKLDLSIVKKLNLRVILRLIRRLFSHDGALVLGVSADWRYRLTYLLYRFNRSKMERSILIVMGGKTPESVTYANRLNGYRRVYVETESMKCAFEAMGVHNVSIYPNCREMPKAPTQIRSSGSGRMSSVFFSLISPDKGVEIALGVAKLLPEVDFHFYGRIEGGYEDRFLGKVDELSNVYYHGVFDSVAGDVLGELSKYDVHLFPTQCPNEGVPGVLVETKMAAVPTVASNVSYNAELVESGKDGIVLDECTAEAMCDAIKALDGDRELLVSMKEAALASAEYFCVDHYLEELVADLENGRKGGLR